MTCKVVDLKDAEIARLRARVLELEAVHEDASGAVLAERERWAGVEQYLQAAADGSMSRNNSQAMAAELMAQIRA